MSDQRHFNQVESASTRSASNPVECPTAVRLAVIGMGIGAVVAALRIPVTYFATLTLIEREVAGFANKYGDGSYDMSGIPQSQITQPVAVAAVLAALEIALWITMAVMNRRGYNWARIVATVLGTSALVIGVVSVALTLIQGNGVAISILYNTVDQGISIVILVLLWLPAASRYYRSQALARATHVARS